MNYLIQLHGEMQGSDGLLRRAPGGCTPVLRENVEPELEHKARRVSEKFSENLHIIANEPSLAFFRIQEHVRKSLPQLVEQKHEVQEIQQNVQGACFDTEYAKNAVNSMQNSRIHFQNIQDLLKNAMFMKQQIEYEESRKSQLRSSGCENIKNSIQRSCPIPQCQSSLQSVAAHPTNSVPVKFRHSIRSSWE